MLEGDLSDFTLPDILRLLAFTAKTGRLHIEGDRFHGRVDLVEGRVRDASADAKHLPLARRLLGLGHAEGDTLVSVLKGRDRLPTDLELARELVGDHGFEPGLVASLLREQTVDAVFDLLRWERGSFRFEMRTDADTSPPDLDLKVDDLLAEADQRLDEWPGIEERTGAGNAVVTIARPSGGTLDIDPEGWALLALVDGHRTVDDLVSLSGRGQFETRRTLGQLVDAGVVAVGDAGRGGAIEKLISDHRSLERAESALQAFTSTERSGEPRRGGGHAPAPSSPAESAAEPAAASAPRTAPSWGDDAPVEPPAADAPGAPNLAGETPAGTDEPGDGRGGDNLRMRVRSDRLTTDPNIDADLVSRLIDGVEGL